MQVFFWAISITGLAYFLLAKRRFDWFTVAFFSACIYFLPGFFGYTAYLSIAGWNEQPINDTAYLVMILVEIAVLSGAFISDLTAFKIKTKVHVFHEATEGNANIVDSLLFLAITAMLLMFFTTGAALFDPDKQEMMGKLNRFHIIFYTATIVGSTLSFELKKWRYFTCFCLLILFDVFIGFRLAMAITSISIFTLWLSKRGKRRLLFSSWKPLVAGLSIALFIFFYKQIAYAVKVGDFVLLRSLLVTPNTYSATIMNSEPFSCQSILNEVTAQHYSVGMAHLKGLMYQVILFAPELGLKAKSFNDLFQPYLFPEVDYGMASNIWAEMWSAGGWYLLMIFILMFILILKIFSVLTATTKKTIWRVLVAVMASYWAFYIHRNGIDYTIALEKRVILVMGLSLVIAFILKKLKSIRKVSVPSAPGERRI